MPWFNVLQEKCTCMSGGRLIRDKISYWSKYLDLISSYAVGFFSSEELFYIVHELSVSIFQCPLSMFRPLLPSDHRSEKSLGIAIGKLEKKKKKKKKLSTVYNDQLSTPLWLVTLLATEYVLLQNNKYVWKCSRTWMIYFTL